MIANNISNLMLRLCILMVPIALSSCGAKFHYSKPQIVSNGESLQSDLGSARDVTIDHIGSKEIKLSGRGSIRNSKNEYLHLGNSSYLEILEVADDLSWMKARLVEETARATFDFWSF